MSEPARRRLHTGETLLQVCPCDPENVKRRLCVQRRPANVQEETPLSLTNRATHVRSEQLVRN